MSMIYPLSIRRRIERQWVERVKFAERQLSRQIVVYVETICSQRVFKNDGLLMPVRRLVDRQVEQPSD
jgi:hypothetical protein